MKRSKKIWSVLLSMGVLLASVGGSRVNAAAKDTKGTVKEADAAVETQSASGIRLSVGDGQKTPQYKAGQNVSKLEIKVTNQGSRKASDVTVTPVVDKASDWPFEIADWNYEKQLGEIPAQKNASAVFENLTVRRDVEGKTYTLKFRIEYTDGDGADKAVEKNVYVKTTAAKKEDSNVQTPQTPSGNNENAAGNGSGNTAGDAPQDQVDYMSGGVANGDPVSSDGGSVSTSVPRVIVSGFRTEPGDVQAGSNFKLIIQVTNTSKKTAVSNMLFDLQAPAAGTEAAAEAPAFLPVSGSSSIYLEGIPAGGTKEISIDLNARADLLQKPYSIAMNVKYEDGNGGQFDASSSIAVPVKQSARFEFSNLEINPESIQVGEEANLTCSLYNLGRTKLYNVKVRFEGEGIGSQEIFVGNVESGAVGNIDGMINGESEMSRDSTCKMIVTYEDESGNQSQTEQEFSMEVLPEQVIDKDSMPAEEEEQKGFPVWLVVFLVLVITAAAAAVIIIRKKKKKREMIEEEELLDEVDRFTENE